MSKRKAMPSVVRRERYEIVKRKTHTPGTLTLPDGRTVPLAKRGPTEIRDAGLARAIDAAHGHKRGNGDVLVIPVDNNHLYDEGLGRIHHYTHTVPELPWQKGRKRYWEK